MVELLLKILGMVFVDEPAQHRTDQRTAASLRPRLWLRFRLMRVLRLRLRTRRFRLSRP